MKFPDRESERVYNIYRDLCEANDLIESLKAEFAVPLECEEELYAMQREAWEAIK